MAAAPSSQRPDGWRVMLEKISPETIKYYTRKCDFCFRGGSDLYKYGEMHTLHDINAHYHCLLMACNLQQHGEDDEGILGFLEKDIVAELKRAKNEICSYCNKHGATIVCVQRMCKKVFHLPCGMEKGSLHHFFNKFQSFCKAHRPYQKVPVYQLAIPDAPICAICFEVVKREVKNPNVVWAPCCKVNAWLHKLCVQKLAYNAGQHFFKCPRCNNKTDFPKAMMQCGIYIPEQDASWELEPNAFEELQHRHDSCDAESCICPQGRDHDVDDTVWEVILCEYCGSKGIHLGCLGLNSHSPNRTWCCTICSKVVASDANASTPSTPLPATDTPSSSGASRGGSNSSPLRPLSLGQVEENSQTKRSAECLDSTSSNSGSEESSDMEWELRRRISPKKRPKTIHHPVNPKTPCSATSSQCQEAAMLRPQHAKERLISSPPTVDLQMKPQVQKTLSKTLPKKDQGESDEEEQEVVDVEEDQKQPERLVTNDGICIPIFLFGTDQAVVTDDTIIEGDLDARSIISAEHRSPVQTPSKIKTPPITKTETKEPQDMILSRQSTPSPVRIVIDLVDSADEDSGSTADSDIVLVGNNASPVLDQQSDDIIIIEDD